MMAMSGGEFARVHDLHAGIEKACGSAPLLAARIDQHHHPARRLLGGDELRRAAHEALDLAPLPERRHRFRLRIPGLDLVRHGPQRAERLAFELAVIRFQLRRVLDVRATDDVFAFHADDSTARVVMRYSIQCMSASASVFRPPKSSTPPACPAITPRMMVRCIGMMRRYGRNMTPPMWGRPCWSAA